MRPLVIDLARPGPWPVRLAWAALVALPAVAVVLVGVGWGWRLEARSIESSRVGVAAAPALPLTGPSSGRNEPPSEAAQALVRVTSAPVAGVLAAIETSLEPGLRVVRLDIDASLGEASLDGEAPGHAEALAWMERMNAPPSRARWVLVRSRLTPSDAGAPGVVFTLRATW